MEKFSAYSSSVLRNLHTVTYKFSRCINFRGFRGSVKFIHKNEEIYIVRCNSHLYFSKSTKIYTLTVMWAAILFLRHLHCKNNLRWADLVAGKKNLEIMKCQEPSPALMQMSTCVSLEGRITLAKMAENSLKF